MEEAGAPWAAFHTLRHTYASLQLAARVNIVQLSRALGHHFAAFTLDTYAHLLDGKQAPALDLTVVLPAPIRLRPVAKRDAAMRRFFESNEIIDPETGESWRPDTLPVIYDPDGDEESSA